MEYAIFRFTLNVRNHRSQATVKAFKGDTAIKLIITLTDGGNTYKINNGCVATLTGTRADGEKLKHDCRIEGDSIIYLFDEETTDCTGLVNCEITLYGANGGVLTAPKFTIDVDEKEVEGTEPISEYSAEAIATVMGAAAKEYAREQAENAREENEAARQESYNNAINTANEAKALSETAEENSNTAINTANNASTQASNAVTASGEAKTEAGNAKAEADKAVAMVESASLSYDPVNGHLIFSYVQDGVTKPKPPIDLPLESAIINMEEITDASGQPILRLELASGAVTEVKLDDIFRGFLKSNSTPNIVYANGADGKETVIPVDADKYSVGSIVRRKRGGEVSVEPAIDDDDAVPLSQARRIFVCVPENPESEANKNSVFVIDEYGSVQNYPFDPDIHSLFAIRDNYSGLLVPLQPISENHAASKYYVDGYVNDLTYRVDQLESASLKYTEFSGVTKGIQVPANSARYAIVEKIGGMTHKVVGDNLWDTKSTVTSEEGITVNEDGSITLNGAFGERYIGIPKFDGGTHVCLSLGTDALDSGNGIYLSYYREEDDSLDETGVLIENGVAWWDSMYNAVLVINGIFKNVKIYPMLVYGTEPKPYKPFSKILLSTDVTSIRSEEANGTLVDSITIPDAVKDKLPEHFEFGDGFEFGVDEVYYGNYLDTLTETIHGNVARMVLDGSEIDASGNSAWRVKTNSNTGVTRFQINYSTASGGLGHPVALVPSTNDKTRALCNAYDSVSASANNGGAKGIAFSSTTFFVHDPAFSTLDAWKAHLKNNPLTVVYRVARPVTENVSNIISDAFNRIAVRSLGKVKPMSDSGMAATMTIAFVEAKGAE